MGIAESGVPGCTRHRQNLEETGMLPMYWTGVQDSPLRSLNFKACLEQSRMRTSGSPIGLLRQISETPP